MSRVNYIDAKYLCRLDRIKSQSREIPSFSEINFNKKFRYLVTPVLELFEEKEISKEDVEKILLYIVSYLVGNKLSETLNVYIEKNLESSIKYLLTESFEKQ